jgi:hypothetical protein
MEITSAPSRNWRNANIAAGPVSGSPGTVRTAVVAGRDGNAITLVEGLTGGRMGR